MFRFLGKKIRELFKGKVNEEALEQLEALFYQADLGKELAIELTEQVRSLYRNRSTASVEEILEQLRQTLLHQLETPSKGVEKAPIEGPQVILVVGANGNGKTTSIAKLAHLFQCQGKKTLIAAADTFRAAAVEQLERWATQVGAALVKGQLGGDPAAVAFDAIQAAKSRGYDRVLIDTAGRLHTKSTLMQELAKIYKVSDKALPGAPHETFLVLDATTGQNGYEQARAFHQVTPLSGIILTKYEGTARGGILLSIQKRLQLPVRYVGTGETKEALQLFNPAEFVQELFR